MFRKILFLVLLAGIGFGIYTGIHKIFEVVTTPKTSISTGTQYTGNTTVVAETPTSGSDIEKPVEVVTETNSGSIQEPGFFARTWATIKGWFSSNQDNGITIPEEDSATGAVLSGEIITGEILSGDNLSGNTTMVDFLGSGKIISQIDTGKSDINSGTLVSTEVIIEEKPASVVKKPTSTVQPNTSTKDPILDALFK